MSTSTSALADGDIEMEKSMMLENIQVSVLEDAKVLDNDTETKPFGKKKYGLAVLAAIALVLFCMAVDVGFCFYRLSFFKIHHANIALGSTGCSGSACNAGIDVYTNIPLSSAFFKYDLSSASTCQMTSHHKMEGEKYDDRFLMDLKPQAESSSSSNLMTKLDFSAVQSVVKLQVTDLDNTEFNALVHEQLKDEDVRDKKTKVKYNCDMQYEVQFMDMTLYRLSKQTLSSSIKLSDIAQTVEDKEEETAEDQDNKGTTHKWLKEFADKSSTDALGQTTVPINYSLHLSDATASGIAKHCGYLTVSVPSISMEISPSTTLVKQEHKLLMSVQPFVFDSRDARVQTDMKMKCFVGSDIDHKCALLSSAIDTASAVSVLKEPGTAVDFNVDLASSDLLESSMGASHKISLNRGKKSSERRSLALQGVVPVTDEQSDGLEIKFDGKVVASAFLSTSTGRKLQVDIDVDIMGIPIEISTTMRVEEDGSTVIVSELFGSTITAMYDTELDISVSHGELNVTLVSDDLSMDMYLYGAFTNNEEDGVSATIASWLSDVTDSTDVSVIYDVEASLGGNILEETLSGVSVKGLGAYVNAMKLTIMDVEYLDISMAMEMLFHEEDGNFYPLEAGSLRMYAQNEYDTKNSDLEFYLSYSLNWVIAKSWSTGDINMAGKIELLRSTYLDMDMAMAWASDAFSMDLTDYHYDMTMYLNSAYNIKIKDELDAIVSMNMGMHLTDAMHIDTEMVVDVYATTIDDLDIQFDMKMTEQIAALGQDTLRDGEVIWMNSSAVMSGDKRCDMGLSISSSFIEEEMNEDTTEPHAIGYFAEEAYEYVRSDAGLDLLEDMAVTTWEVVEVMGLDTILPTAAYFAYVGMSGLSELLFDADIVSVLEEVIKIASEPVTDITDELDEFDMYVSMSLSPQLVVIPEPPTMAPSQAQVASIPMEQTLTGVTFADFQKDQRKTREVITDTILQGLPSTFTSSNIQDLIVTEGAVRRALLVSDRESRALQSSTVLLSYTITVYPEQEVSSVDTLVADVTNYAESEEFTSNLASTATASNVGGFESVTSTVEVGNIAVTTEAPTSAPADASSSDDGAMLGIIIGVVVVGVVILVGIALAFMCVPKKGTSTIAPSEPAGASSAVAPSKTAWEA